jgi:hypothetical protein
MKNLIFIQLNEINFDVIREYLKTENYENLRFISNNILVTTSEKKYNLLEPWIQWQTIYTGLKAEKHNIFRLGDVEKKKIPQFYEKLEKLGYSVGAICPMNCMNRCQNPSYFIPDPWTKSNTDNSQFSKIIYNVLRETVNNNANNKIGIKNYFLILFLFFYFSQIKYFFLYIYYFVTSFKYKWRKTLFLDLLLHDIHIRMYKKKNPNFSTIFYNAGAHIQHHYFFNSKANRTNLKNSEKFLQNNKDPFNEVISLYNKILADYLTIKSKNIILATGLTQDPTNTIEYYYRLSDHQNFLRRLKISFEKVYPRMSRDFLIKFKSKDEINCAYDILSKLKLNGQKVFGILEKRENEIFVTLTYSKEILMDDILYFNDTSIKIFFEVSFVSIKNGKHSSKGFLFLNGDIQKFNKTKLPQSITNLHNIILNYFA